MKSPAGTTVFIGVGVAVVVAAVVAGLMVLPTPGEERSRRLDERRVEDLRGITRAMDLYWTRHGRLPTSLAELSAESDVTVSTHDPSTGQDYDLRPQDAATYELCADFEQASAVSGDPAGNPRDMSEDFWSHGVGRRCFRLETQEVPARERISHDGDRDDRA